MQIFRKTELKFSFSSETWLLDLKVLTDSDRLRQCSASKNETEKFKKKIKLDFAGCLSGCFQSDSESEMQTRERY